MIAAIESIKTAKYNDNSAMGLVSNNMDFRDARDERATACKMVRKWLKTTKLK